MKKRLPLLLVLILGIMGIIPYYSPQPIVTAIDSFVLYDLLRIIGSFALVLGLGSLLTVHFHKIRRHRENWQYSWVLILSFVATAIIGLFGGRTGEGILPTSIGSFQFNIQVIFEHVNVPLGSTMFSLLAFFMASAAYRAFRARSLDATLLLATAFIVMLGLLPLGDRISHHLPSFVQWIMDIPNVASKRGIGFGIALGSIATSLKIILGIERSWLGGTK
jgi:uncharacterized membrane protein